MKCPERGASVMTFIVGSVKKDYACTECRWEKRDVNEPLVGKKAKESKDE